MHLKDGSREQNIEGNHLYGEPPLKAKYESDPEVRRKCARIDLEEDEADENCS